RLGGRVGDGGGRAVAVGRRGWGDGWRCRGRLRRGCRALGEQTHVRFLLLRLPPPVAHPGRRQCPRRCHAERRTPAAAARPCSCVARPIRLVLISDRGARSTTGSPKLIAAIAFLKSL